MSGPIRTVIVDDEPLARERLRTLCGGHGDVEVVAECRDGREAIEVIGRTAPDLVLLDVQMIDVDGFEVVEALEPEALPLVIFVTAYDRHAVRAFEVHALDYLLKPFDRERFERALARARAVLRGGGPGGGLDGSRRRMGDLIDAMRGPRDDGSARRLVVRSGGRVVFLDEDEIDWVEAAGNYLRLHCGPETHLHRETMTALERRLDPERFARIHRSTIVNLDRVRELQPLEHGEYAVLLADGTTLTLSRRYRKRVSGLDS